MTTLLLVRHGETDWNADGRLQGHTDRPLSDFGRRQAQGLAEELADEELEAIWAGKKTPKQGLDDGVKRGNEIIERFNKANKS